MAKKSAQKKEQDKKPEYSLPVGQSQKCPIDLLLLDLGNPRLQTGTDISAKNEVELMVVLADIAALDELVTSICTNTYLNLEPLIVVGDAAHGPFRVLEGNRRLAAIKIINDAVLAKTLGIKVPQPVRKEVVASMKELLVYRVARPEDAREFIGFKHINGPQRWDAYAKARYVTEWYKNAKGRLDVNAIAAKMGDNNNTLRSYIYSILILEQAEREQIWLIKDRSNVGRFAFSHLYTALGRKEYQQHLGLTSPWLDKPPVNPIKIERFKELGEVLTFIYGSKSADRSALVRSQNPDLKYLGEAIVNPRAYAVLANKGTLEEALDEMKDASEAFQDALVATNLRIRRAINLMPKYQGGKPNVDKLVDEIFEQADTLKTINDKKRKSAH